MHARIGGIFDPILDVLTSVFDRVPGSEWVKRAASEGASFLGDMAKDERGFWILSVVNAAFVVPPIAHIVGPQVASIAWVLPQIVRGDKFSEAYVREVAERVEEVVAYFAGRKASEAAQKQLAASFKNGIERVAQDPELRRIVTDPLIRAAVDRGIQETQAELARRGLSPGQIAQRLGLRADAVALALNLLFGHDVYDVASFDVETGAEPVIGAPPPRGKLGKRGTLTEPRPKTAADLLVLLGDAEKRATNPKIVAALRNQYEIALAEEAKAEAARQRALFFRLGPEPSVTFAKAEVPIGGGAGPKGLFREIGVTLLLLSPAIVPLILLQLPSKRRTA